HHGLLVLVDASRNCLPRIYARRERLVDILETFGRGRTGTESSDPGFDLIRCWEILTAPASIREVRKEPTFDNFCIGFQRSSNERDLGVSRPELVQSVTNILGTTDLVADKIAHHVDRLWVRPLVRA